MRRSNYLWTLYTVWATPLLGPTSNCWAAKHRLRGRHTHKQSDESIAAYWTAEMIQSAIPREILVHPEEVGWVDEASENGRSLVQLFDPATQKALPRNLDRPNEFLVPWGDTFLQATVEHRNLNEDEASRARRLAKPQDRQIFPGQGDVVTQSDITFVFEASDPDGAQDLSSIEIFVASNNSVTQSTLLPYLGNAQYTLELGPFDSGEYRWAVVVKDKSGDSSPRVMVPFTIDLSAATSDQPSASPTVSLHPTEDDSEAPTSLTLSPSVVISEAPTLSLAPTNEVSEAPTLSLAPTVGISEAPSMSLAPTMEGSTSPSVSSPPTAIRSSSPSATVAPTTDGSNPPSLSPVPITEDSAFPSLQPSSVPTGIPSLLPSTSPTNQPSNSPSARASGAPSQQSSSSPSYAASTSPSQAPTTSPSILLSASPSRMESSSPSLLSSSSPSEVSSASPSEAPSSSPVASVDTVISQVSFLYSSPKSEETLTVSGDSVTFEWEVATRMSSGKKIERVTLMILYPDGGSAYREVDLDRRGRGSSIIRMNGQTGEVSWALIARVSGTSTTIHGPWSTFTFAPVPTVPRCEPLARYMERDKGIHKASGRILFQIGTGHYICSGTLVQGPNDRAVIATAAHCLYDQATNVFASNVLFIPGQDDGSGEGSNRDCRDDSLGCLYPRFAVVSDEYGMATPRGSFAYDYGFYVAPDSDPGPDVGPHVHSYDVNGHASIEPMAIDFGVQDGLETHLFGYPGNVDPNFMYSIGTAEISPLGAEFGMYVECVGLTGGASGGAWTQADVSTGTMVVHGVNSWAWGSGRLGMGTSAFDTGGAQCVYNAAVGASMTSGDIVANCPP